MPKARSVWARVPEGGTSAAFWPTCRRPGSSPHRERLRPASRLCRFSLTVDKAAGGRRSGSDASASTRGAQRWRALALVSACSSRRRAEARKEAPHLLGPADKSASSEPPPYGLARYGARTAGMRRGFPPGGERACGGSDPLRGACEDQWTTEARTTIPPVERRPLRMHRGGMACAGWEAKRILPDGTRMRLRTLCGAGRRRSVYLYQRPGPEPALRADLGEFDPAERRSGVRPCDRPS
jgi:hypothetical protein